MSYFTADYLKFFRELIRNNNKEWFHANKKRYQKSVREPFLAMTTDLIRHMERMDPEMAVDPRKALFRINRDIRFSKDKTPYKKYMAARIHRPGGSCGLPGFYVHFGPETAAVAGGAYEMDKESLYRLRQHITDHPGRLDELLTDKEFRSTYGELQGAKNKILPKEFRSAAEGQPLLFHKQFYVYRNMEPETVVRDDLLEYLLRNYRLLRPLNQFLTEGMTGS